jgi:SecD/SecF fusion protein
VGYGVADKVDSSLSTVTPHPLPPLPKAERGFCLPVATRPATLAPHPSPKPNRKPVTGGIISGSYYARRRSLPLQLRSYLFLGVVVLLTALSGWLFSARKFNYGLDVQGGVRLVYQLEQPKNKNITMAEAQRRVLTVFQNRAAGGLGVAEPVIQPKGDDQIIVELPGAISIEEARNVMGTTAKLEWYHANNVKGPQASFRPYTASNNPDSSKPEVWLTDNQGNSIKPRLENGQPNPRYASIIKSWPLILEGEDLKDARPQAAPGGNGYQPTFEFTSEGARKMEQWCRNNFGREENLAAVLDGRILSLSHLQKEAIISDQGVISGSFDAAYVISLTDLLKSGALPVDLKEISSNAVDPTIGTFALNQIVQTGVIAFAIIALFMIIYYVFPGVIALIALLLYVLFTLTALKMVNATFSLAAIAGFILSVGMAVDANILVFERVKEEMREGRPLMTSIELGFKRAFSAILDSNACTIITSLVLSSFGTGPVKGFASTLIIGVAISLFTAVVVTRSLLVFLVGSGLGANPKWYGLSRGWFGERLESEANTKPLKIIEKSKLYFIISILTIIPGMIFLAMGGLKKNVEFSGGFEVQYVAQANTSSKSIIETLESKGIRGANVKFGTGSEAVMGADGKPLNINGQPAKLGADGKPLETETLRTQNVRLAMVTVPPTANTPLDKVPESKAYILTALGLKNEDVKNFSYVGSTIRDETIRNAVMGVLLSCGGIILFLSIRFGLALGGMIIGFRFAMSVILALIHDVLVVIGIAAILGALLGWEMSALFISAMLTVIGFSTHDTIVIFDRIRENLRKPLPGEDLSNLVNRSITQSIARSINTSSTVIVTLILLIALGSASPDLQFFNAVMLAGIISGTYSSIFNASPILYLWDKLVIKNKGEEGSLIAIARRSQSRVRLTRPEVATDGAPAEAAKPAAGYAQTRRRRASEQYNQNIDDEL